MQTLSWPSPFLTIYSEMGDIIMKILFFIIKCSKFCLCVCVCPCLNKNVHVETDICVEVVLQTTIYSKVKALI